jgi:hypothetical protein
MPKKTKQERIAWLAQKAREEIDRPSVMTSWERGLEEDARKHGQAEMDRRLAELLPENGRPKACPRCGKNARVRARAVARDFKSMWGTHTVTRDYYYCEGCSTGFYPRDEFLGLPKEGELTDEVESRIADFAINDAYPMAEARWRVHYRHMPVSENQFRQVMKRLGQDVEETELTLWESALKPPSTEASARLYVMADGGMVPTRGGWREVKVGVLFREECHVRGDATRRGNVLEPRYTACLGEQSEFKAQLRASLDVENAARAKEVVWLADGAPGNWLLARALAPEAVQVLDWCHALQHACDAGKALLGEGDASLDAWRERAASLLSAGEVSTLLRELRECRVLVRRNPAARDALSALIAYYETNEARMDYAGFRQRGILIGSGIVESAHRHVIQTRMKKAGQRWSVPGARRMARLRAAYRTAGPERFYAAVRWAHRRSLAVAHHLPKPHRTDLRKLRAL